MIKFLECIYLINIYWIDSSDTKIGKKSHNPQIPYALLYKGDNTHNVMRNTSIKIFADVFFSNKILKDESKRINEGR